MIAAMDADTRRTNPALLRRAALSVRQTASTTTTSDRLATLGGVHTRRESGRGILWERTGSREFSAAYHQSARRLAAAAGGGDP
jgi:hypothetical protein